MPTAPTSSFTDETRPSAPTGEVQPRKPLVLMPLRSPVGAEVRVRHPKNGVDPVMIRGRIAARRRGGKVPLDRKWDACAWQTKPLMAL